MTRFVAVAFVVALVSLPATAHAQSTQARLTATRHAIEATAQRWFAAQAESASINTRIREVEGEMRDAQARVDRDRVVATERAVDVYKGAAVSYTGMFGDDAIDSGRRAEFIDTANAKNMDAINALTDSVDNLKSQHRALLAQRAAQDKALQEVAAQRDTLDRQLASLHATLDRTATRTTKSSSRHRSSRSGSSSAYAAATAPTPALVTVARIVPATSGRVSPHHNATFLICTRARESSGSYDAVSPAGYYGAYQFAPSTWDVTAIRAGRNDLVGVLPSLASEYDQDELAWTLYQWQGNGPWGGRC